MAIGIVSDDDFLQEVERRDKSPVPELKPAQIPGTVIDINRGGRAEGDNNVPDSIRQIIQDEALNNGRASALSFAKMVGVSDSSVSAYSKGSTSTSTYHKPTVSLSKRLNKTKFNIAKKASARLNLALENITEDKLAEAKVTDLALVAKSMSGIIKDMEPPAENRNGDMNFNGPSIVMYNPGFSKESSFETVNLEE